MNHLRVFASLVAGSIAVLGAIVVAAIADVSVVDVTVFICVTFIAGFFTVLLLMEKLVFRPLKEVSRDLSKGALRAERDQDAEQRHPLAPVATFVTQVRQYAADTQREIERLKKLEAFRKDFIADVSHELKTPIFAAQGFVHTLLDGAVKEKAVRKKFLKKAAKSLDGLDVLVQDLLTLSHIETGQIKMRFEEIDLYALTLDVLDQFRDRSDKKAIGLRIDGPVRKVLVQADWQRIRQVMTNLISNAIKHSSEGQDVVVSFSIRKKSVITRVADQGEGISPEHTNRIFERFYRVDKSRSREKGGTGLGLAIVKHILEGHSTEPRVESEPGKGSTFSFKLPRYRNEGNENGTDEESTTS